MRRDRRKYWLFNAYEGKPLNGLELEGMGDRIAEGDVVYFIEPDPTASTRNVDEMLGDLCGWGFVTEVRFVREAIGRGDDAEARTPPLPVVEIYDVSTKCDVTLSTPVRITGPDDLLCAIRRLYLADIAELEQSEAQVIEELISGLLRTTPIAPEATSELPPMSSEAPAEKAAVRVDGGAHRGASYDLFLSHASEDKDAIARPLYAALTANGISVWFDEAVLELGDSLRRKIDDGLARCRYGVVILSPRFLAKEWPQRELDGLVARETASGEKAILPIWHDLDRDTLIQYSPVLADRLAARSIEGVPALAERILRVLKKIEY